MEIIGEDSAYSAFLAEWASGCPMIHAHTSGSTGTPKEIWLNRSDMLRSARATCRFFGLTSSDTLASPLSASYIAGKMMVIRAIISGARLIVEHPSQYPLHSLSSSEEIALLPIVPTQIPGLLASPRLSQVRNVIVGGAPISASEEEALRCAGVDAYATYGMTETCSHVALRSLLRNERAYQAMPGVHFSADSRRCLIVDIEADGEGAGPVHLVTNDVVNLLSDSRFEWVGRADCVINSGGIKIHPEQVERALGPVIHEMFGPETAFYVVGRPSMKWGEHAVLVIEGREEEVDVAMLQRRFSELLPGPYRPKGVEVRENIPRTSSGKIIRN